MSLKSHQSRKRIFSSGQMQQQRYSDQEDSAFQSSQCYGGSQMMNSQDNSQNSSFDLFSQLQGVSQQNENVSSSHRFYTKYMSKAPLFPRESSQSERNPLPRRRSFQDVQEYNRQKAKERDDRDLINTFIALVKECADEVKNAADDIKNSVDKNMKDSASQSATLMKKLNEDLSEHYNTLLDSIKEKESEQNKVAELEQALAAKKARIEVLESQLEIAKQTKEDRVIQSVVDAYAQQQQLNREHLNQIQDEQQQFTKEQVDIINQKREDQLAKHQDQLKKHQDELEKSFLVEFSEKQSAKCMDTNKDTSTETDTLSINKSQPQPASTNLSHLQSSTVMDNQASHYGVIPVPATQPQPQPSSFVQLTASQKSVCPIPVTNYQTCNINSRCCYNDFEYPMPNNPAVPFQAATIPTSVSFPTYNNMTHQPMNNQHVHSQPERNTCTQPQYHPQQARSNVSQCVPQPAPMPVSRRINSSDIALLSMTSPTTDNPSAVLWSRASRLKPSPVATVAPQVKHEHPSPQEIEDSGDDSQVEDFPQQSSQVQQRRSTRGSNAKKRPINEPRSRRSSARVQAKNQPSTDMQPAAKPKSRQTKKSKVQQSKQQRQVYQQKRVSTQQPDVKATNKKNTAAQRKRKQEDAVDVYEFEDESRFIPSDVPTTKRIKKNTGASHHIQTSFSKQKVPQNDAQRSYPDWVSKSKGVTARKPQHKSNQFSHQWIVQDNQSTDDEYEFNDSQGIDESPQEQIVPQKRFGNSYNSNTGKSVQRYRQSKSKSNFLSYCDDESSEEITFSLESPEYAAGRAVYRQQKQETQIFADDAFLSTPCLQTVEYDSSEDSQLVTGFKSAPGSAVQRKVSRQAERKRRLQAVVRQIDVDHTLAKISRSISKQRQRIKCSGTFI